MNVFNRYLAVFNMGVDLREVNPRQSLVAQFDSVLEEETGINADEFGELMQVYANREGAHGRNQHGEMPLNLAFNEENIVVFSNASMLDKRRFEEHYDDAFVAVLLDGDDFIRLKAAHQAYSEGRDYKDVIAEKDLSASAIPPEELNS